MIGPELELEPDAANDEIDGNLIESIQRAM
jgi:hypothetical protein